MQAACRKTRPQHALRDLDADPAVADDLLGEGVARVEQRVTWNHSRDETDPLRLGRVDVTPRQHDVERA